MVIEVQLQLMLPLETNENKVNCLIVTYVAKPRKPTKRDETRL
jgi:hypothetical protein